jgi:hypothetical protein
MDASTVKITIWTSCEVAVLLSMKTSSLEMRQRTHNICILNLFSLVSPCGICGGQSGTGTGFSPSTSVFPRQFHCTGAPWLGKGQKIIINLIVIFIIGLHKEPQGCGASVAPAAGPFTAKRKIILWQLIFVSTTMLSFAWCVRECPTLLPDYKFYHSWYKIMKCNETCYVIKHGNMPNIRTNTYCVTC